jgi:hypothetical protein
MGSQTGVAVRFNERYARRMRAVTFAVGTQRSREARISIDECVHT